MKKHLTIRDDFFEEKIHGNYGFPFELSHDTLSAFEHGFLDCHWHPDIELSLVLDGAMEYQVNETIYPLTKGCGIFVNANNLHTARAYEGQDCTYLSIIFNPVLVFGHENSSIAKNYVDTLIRTGQFAALCLNPVSDSHQQLIRLFLEINTLYQNKALCYELLIKSKLCELWAILFQEFRAEVQPKNSSGFADIPRIKQILNYIHANYDQKLTLNEIACSCNISKSECCRFFKKIIRQTPFEYLLNYRIQKSITLLLDKTLSVTEIAEKVGFSTASYYSEIFRRYLGCSPTEYRKLH